MGVAAGGVQAVLAGTHYALGSFGSLVEEPFSAQGNGGTIFLGIGFIGHVVVFAEGALEQGHAGLEGQRGVLVHAEAAVGPAFGQFHGGVVQIFDDLLHDVSTGIARLEERSLVGRPYNRIIIGDIAIILDHLIVVEGPEEVLDTLVFGAGFLAPAVLAVLEELVNVS